MSRHLKVSVLLAVLAALIAAGIASAHANFMRSDPKPNSVLASPPARINIWFTEAIESGFSAITVLYQDGSTADLGDSAVAPSDPSQLGVSLGDTREGTYLVSWRVLSAIDGHITSGAWVYSVGKPIDRSVNAQAGGSVTNPLDMLARALIFIGQAALVGMMLFRWLVWRPALKAADVDETADEQAVKLGKRIASAALGLAFAGAVLTLIAQSTSASATIPAWLNTRVGRVWIGRAATLIALAVLTNDIAAFPLGQRAGRGRMLLNIATGWLGLQLLLTTSLTSHSAAVANPPIIPLLTDWLHLIATAVWVGGLAQMAFVVPAVVKLLDDEDRAWLWLKTVVNFSTVAAAGIGILLITGTYLSFLHVGDWAALINTIYGRSLLFKLALAGVAMLLGAYNLFVVKPRLDRAVDAPGADSTRAIQNRFRRLVALEAIAAMAVLAAAGIMTTLPRSKDPQPAVEGQPLELATRADELDAALTIDPATSGTNTFDIHLSRNGQPVTDADTVSLRFTFLSRSVGTTEAKAEAMPDGTYAVSGSYLSLPGDWQIEIAVRRTGAFDAFAAFRVKAGLDGRIGPAEAATVFESLSRWLSIYGLAFGGGVAIVMGLVWLAIGWKAARSTLAQLVLLIPALIALPIGGLSIVTFFREATPGLALSNPFLPDEPSLAIGKQVFEANCAVCHGPAGRGDGPSAAQLSPRPPDYGNGHLDIHTDGDIFFWIQNGFPGSAMPAFKGKLSDDEIWNVVNTVRRLRELAGDAIANQAVATSEPSALQPYTPPSFIAPPEAGLGVTPQPPTPSASGDPAALDLLRRSDEAMNRLTSLVEDQTLHDDHGGQLSVRFEYNAPDRLRYQIVNGATSIQVGTADYQLDPNGNWIKNQRAVPLEWPNFYYGQVADGARIDTSAPDTGGAKIVAFEYGGFDFRVWIDPATYRITQLKMDGKNHHMVTAYSAFNSGPKIDAPIP